MRKSSIALLLVLFAAMLALLHAALVSALLALGHIDAAEALSINDPDVAQAQAKHYRVLALNTGNQQHLATSLEYWQQAISIRPLWPYYHVGALDVELSLQDAAAVQQRVSHIIKLAPNERGLDKHFLTLSFMAWDMVADDDKPWLLARLDTVNRRILKQVIRYATDNNNHQDICAKLAWKKVRAFCAAH